MQKIGTGIDRCRVKWVDTSGGTGSFDVRRRARGVRLDSGEDAPPFGAHRRIAHAVEKEYEETLKVHKDHEQNLQPSTHNSLSLYVFYSGLSVVVFLVFLLLLSYSD